MQITDTNMTRAIELSSRIEGTTVDALLAPSIADLSNGRHIRNGAREPVTADYLAWLESQAVAAEAEREASLHQGIGA